MLTHTKIINLKPKEKPYKVFDSEGLHLMVKPTGRKLWYLKYYYLNKEKKLALGPFPEISLNRARELRFEAKKLLVEGKDPSAHKQEQKRIKIREAGNTFELVAREWIQHKEELWVENTRRTKLLRPEMYVFRPISLNYTQGSSRKARRSQKADP